MQIKSNKLLTKLDDDPLPTPYDCVAIALSYWGCSYVDIENWIQSQYGTGGVPVLELNNVVRKFYPSSIGFDPRYYVPSGLMWIASEMVGVYKADNGYGHMINIEGPIVNDQISVIDNQDTTKYDVPLNRMLYIYYKNDGASSDTVLVNLSVNAIRTMLKKD